MVARASTAAISSGVLSLAAGWRGDEFDTGVGHGERLFLEPAGEAWFEAGGCEHALDLAGEERGVPGGMGEGGGVESTVFFGEHTGFSPEFAHEGHADGQERRGAGDCPGGADEVAHIEGGSGEGQSRVEGEGEGAGGGRIPEYARAKARAGVDDELAGAPPSLPGGVFHDTGQSGVGQREEDEIRTGEEVFGFARGYCGEECVEAFAAGTAAGHRTDDGVAGGPQGCAEDASNFSGRDDPYGHPARCHLRPRNRSSMAESAAVMAGAGTPRRAASSRTAVPREWISVRLPSRRSRESEECASGARRRSHA